MSIAETINEINSIINDLKALTEAGTKLTGAAKNTMEIRIAHLRDKTSPHGVITLSDDLTNLRDKAVIGETPPPATPAAKRAIVGLGFRYLGSV